MYNECAVTNALWRAQIDKEIPFLYSLALPVYFVTDAASTNASE